MVIAHVFFKRENFPVSAAVVNEGKIHETVLTGITDVKDKPIEGGVDALIAEIPNG